MFCNIPLIVCTLYDEGGRHEINHLFDFFKWVVNVNLLKQICSSNQSNLRQLIKGIQDAQATEP